MSDREAGRIDWIDLAKALCILLVVLNHVQMHLPEIAGGASLAVQWWWDGAMLVLRPLRMPLFFLVSGMLASRLLERDFDRGAARRIAHLAYLHALWVPITAFGICLVAGVPLPSPSQLVLPLVGGVATTWYLWALASFLLIAWSSRRLPLWVPIGAALLLTLAVPLIDTVEHRTMLRCLPFFLAGARLPRLAQAIAGAVTPKRVAVAALLYAAVLALSLRLGIFPNALADTAAVLVGIGGCTLAIGSLPHLAAPSRWLAARTLPIYVLHFPVVAALLLASARTVSPALFQSTSFATVFPLLLAAIAVAACLLIHRLLLMAGLNWLFELPKRTRRPVAEEALNPA